ncbi:protein FAM117A-like [Eucyclogobius newberryi]|uniref:protein FAM117A-like n=1 Tax=Eucyclogobius newberryi TaxID=166745 RepID=UPI003B58FDDB
MSSRGALGQSRGAASGLQPLKATIPFQLACKPRQNRREAGKAKAHQQSGMRRTVSLDAIIGPYLLGHWPKEVETNSSVCQKDKSTQTPDEWSDDFQSRQGIGSHKRSASWGSAEHLKEIAKLKQQLQQRSKSGVSGGHDKDLHGYPHGNSHQGAAQTKPIPIPLAPLLTLVPRLRCSVEGLNQELEGMFICQPSPVLQKFLEVPDGHRAPIPSHSCSSGSQSDHASTPFSSSSASSSPCCSPMGISTSPPTSEDMHQGLMESTAMWSMSSSSTQNETELSLLMSSSPGPNKSFCFQREPPEGCEKVRVWEEASTVDQLKPTAVASCPDPNKVNFAPHGGSAFCPVSLLKPLLPSMDLLFRSLSVSPASNLTDQSTSANAPVGCALEAFGEGLAF